MTVDLSWCRKGGSRGYVVIRPIHWRIGGKKSAHMEVIPAGFEFESSVPQGLKWFLSPDDPLFLLSAAVHDWFLEHELQYDYDFCDSQWLAAARKSKAPRRKAGTVRLLMMLRRCFMGDRRGDTWDI